MYHFLIFQGSQEQQCIILEGTSSTGMCELQISQFITLFTKDSNVRDFYYSSTL